MERVLIEVDGVQEARIALDAVKAFRAGKTPTVTIRPELADRLYAVLSETPLPEGARIVLEAMTKAPPKEWVTLGELEDALVGADYTQKADAWGKVRAALAGISWLMNEKMREDAIKAGGGLNLIVTRRLFDGKTRYRLTDAGRAAAERVLAET